MFLAIALLLVQPSITPQIAFSAEKLAIIQPTEISAPVPVPSEPDPVPNPDLVVAPAPQPVDPEPFIATPAIKNETITVTDLRAETRHQELRWFELGLVEHGAAEFDAYSTRRAIVDEGGHELNPFFKPFAGNASMYVAIQVGPAVMDFVAKKMMFNEHRWIRRMWWIPQSASTVTSIFCGAHNLGVRSPGN